MSFTLDQQIVPKVMRQEVACIQEIAKDSFAILIDSEFKNLPNKILIFNRTANLVREIMNPNPNPEFLGIRLLPLYGGEDPLILVRDREHISVVDVTTGTVVNLFSSPIEVDQMSAFYLDVREENGKYEIFTMEYVKGSLSKIIKYTAPKLLIRELIGGYKQLI
jgi:hypothetical protein